MSLREEQKRHTCQRIVDTALLLSIEHGCFSAFSLRELSRHVGLVPTAFYRHFPNMNALALELVDRGAIHLHACYQHLIKIALQQPTYTLEEYLNTFLTQVHTSPMLWSFFLIERYTGQNNVKAAIRHEIQFLQQNMQHDLKCLACFSLHENNAQFTVFIEMLVEVLFHHILDELAILQTNLVAPSLALAQHRSKAIAQIELLYAGLQA